MSCFSSVELKVEAMMMRKNSWLDVKNKLRGLAASLAVTLTFGSVAAHAADLVKFYPGVMCSSDSSTASDWRSGRMNPGLGSVDLICPIVRERIGVPFEAVVGALDQNYTQELCCSSRSANAVSGPFRFTANQCSSGTNGSPQLLVFSGPDLAYGWDYRWLQCNVPAAYSGQRSGISAYWSVEK